VGVTVGKIASFCPRNIDGERDSSWRRLLEQAVRASGFLGRLRAGINNAQMEMIDGNDHQQFNERRKCAAAGVIGG